MTTALNPSSCESIADLLAMDSTNKSIGDFDMLIQHDQAVIFTKQSMGKQCEQQITIPKRVFRRMLEWYQEEQK